MSIDLRDSIEGSFGDGPGHRPIDERLAAGRRALRRRRVFTASGTVAAVAAVALSPAAVSHVNGATDGQVPVTRPSPHATLQSASPEPEKPVTRTTISPGHTYADNPIPREESPVTFEGDRLVAKPGATVTARIADPPYSSSAIPGRCTARAVAVTDGPTDLFVLGYTCPHGAWDLFTETAGTRADTLPDWLAAVKAAQDGGEGVR